jgi:uncharacterized DUF497 family protein
VFLDPWRIDEEDSRRDYGEARRIAIGMMDGGLTTLAYTVRGEVCRLITAWAASRKQRKRYHGQVGS